MQRWIIALVALVAAHAAAATPEEFRFQALLDLDRNAATGCALQTAAGDLQGLEARIYALTDRAQVNLVVAESCQRGVWHVDSAFNSERALGLRRGPTGGDLIEWSVARHWFTAYPQLSIRMLAEHTGTGAFDRLGGDAAFAPLALDLVGTRLPIPILGAFGLVVLTIVLVVLALRPLRDGAIRLPAALALALILLVPGPTPTAHSAAAAIGEAKAVTSSVQLSDPAGDAVGNEPGVDVLHAGASADAERIHFEIEVGRIDEPALPAVTRVLFVGNSLTYFNDLPLMLQAIAAQAGKPLVTDAVTIGGANLEDHYHDGRALAAIRNGHYQVVILQQGPSSLTESQADLLLWSGRFNAPIRTSGAKPALYMVWPEFERSSFFDAVRASYLNAAIAIDGMFIPAGETWRAAWRVDPALPLYGADRFHPSPLGSYAAALSMYVELYRQTPVGLPPRLVLANGDTLQFSATQARTVQEAAWSAHLQYGRGGR